MRRIIGPLSIIILVSVFLSEIVKNPILHSTFTTGLVAFLVLIDILEFVSQEISHAAVFFIFETVVPYHCLFLFLLCNVVINVYIDTLSMISH